MKKIIIGTLGALFASAIAVAVWSSNVKANDLLAMNVEALAGENGDDFPKPQVYYLLVGGYHHGWINYSTKTIKCVQYVNFPIFTTSYHSSNTDSSANVNAQLGATAEVPTANLNSNLSASSGSHDEYLAGWTGYQKVAERPLEVCASGLGKCGDPSYKDPCASLM